MGLIQSDRNVFGTILSRVTAARAAALDRLTAARGTLLDNLSNLDSKLVPTQYQSDTSEQGLQVAQGSSWTPWYQIFASANFDAAYLILYGNGGGGNGFSAQIGVGAAGSETVLKEVRIGNVNPFCVEIPVAISSGSRVVYRWRNSNATTNAKMLLAG